MEDDDFDDDDDDDLRRRSRRRRDDDTGLKILIWGLAIGVPVCFIGIVLLVGVLVAVYRVKPEAEVERSPAPPVNTGAWEPDAALLTQLGPDTPLAGAPEVSIRPPSGYTLSHRPGKTSILSMWVGPRQRDGLSPVFTASAYRPRYDLAGHVDLESEINAFYTGVKRKETSVTNLRRGPSEMGELGHQPAVRARLFGDDVSRRRPRVGFIYIIAATQHAVAFFSFIPQAEERSLHLMETAVLTFQKH